MANFNFTNSVDFTTHLTLTPEFNFFLSLLVDDREDDDATATAHDGEDDDAVLSPSG